MAGAFRGICEPPSCVQSKSSRRTKKHLVGLMGSQLESVLKRNLSRL